MLPSFFFTVLLLDAYPQRGILWCGVCLSVCNAAFTPAQQVARNKLRVTCCLKQHVARNKLRWCKRGITLAYCIEITELIIKQLALDCSLGSLFYGYQTWNIISLENPLTEVLNRRGMLISISHILYLINRKR